MTRLFIETDNGRELEVLGGSHISLKETDGNELFWEWESLESIHKELKKILQDAEDTVEQVKEILPDPIVGGQIYS